MLRYKIISKRLLLSSFSRYSRLYTMIIEYFSHSDLTYNGHPLNTNVVYDSKPPHRS